MIFVVIYWVHLFYHHIWQISEKKSSQQDLFLKQYTGITYALLHQDAFEDSDLVDGDWTNTL